MTNPLMNLTAQSGIGQAVNQLIGTTTQLALPKFDAPARLWVLLIVPVLLVVYLLMLFRKPTNAIRYPNTAVLEIVLPKTRNWRRHLAVLMSMASLVSLALAWAKPLGKEMVPRQEATIVLVLDISQSMGAKDVTPTRFDSEKEAAKNFVDSLPEKFNIAVVALSGSPNIVVPATTDRSMVMRAIDHLEMADGTATGQAIDKALDAIEQARSVTKTDTTNKNNPATPNNQPSQNPTAKPGDTEKIPGAVVLLSDGASTDDNSGLEQALQKAKDNQVQINTIAFGTQTGYVDLDGKRELVPPDTETMQKIAQTTGGQYRAASDTKELNSTFENVKSKVGYEQVEKPVTARWAMYSLGFAVIAALGAVSMAVRWP